MNGVSRTSEIHFLQISAKITSVTKILLVEDDANICTAVRLLLEQENWEVEEAASAEEGVAQFTDDTDLVLLDLMLPKMDGFEFCKYIRTYSTVPIIILTAREDIADLVQGLTDGADDYVMKPFVPQELMARIQALLRRAESSWPVVKAGKLRGLVRYGDIEIDHKNRKIFRNGEEIVLTHTEGALMAVFLENIGEPVSREHLSEKIWGDKEISTNRLVDIQVSRLRLKMEDDVSSPRYIRTVRKVGYKLAL